VISLYFVTILSLVTSTKSVCMCVCQVKWTVLTHNVNINCCSYLPNLMEICERFLKLWQKTFGLLFCRHYVVSYLAWKTCPEMTWKKYLQKDHVPFHLLQQLQLHWFCCIEQHTRSNMNLY